jgi:hypothetical protein
MTKQESQNCNLQRTTLIVKRLERQKRIYLKK